MKTKTKQNPKPTKTDVMAIRMLVRLRDDFQGVRKRMDNRIGRKADGASQNVGQRPFRPEDLDFFTHVSSTSKDMEKNIEKRLSAILKRFPVWNLFLSEVKGMGPVSAAWIIAEIDIHRATTVSKMWQFCGLNPEYVEGKKRVEEGDGSFKLVPTGHMIPGDRMTKGYVSPFNKRLRTALAGVLCEGFMKAGLRWEEIPESEYPARPSPVHQRRDVKEKGQGTRKNVPHKAVITSPYVQLYLNYKHRLEHSNKKTNEMRAGGKTVQVKWKDAKRSHRDRAAQRYMLKIFLQDLYNAWREIEGLPVRVPYQEEYLDHKHDAGAA